VFLQDVGVLNLPTTSFSTYGRHSHWHTHTHTLLFCLYLIWNL